MAKNRWSQAGLVCRQGVWKVAGRTRRRLACARNKSSRHRIKATLLTDCSLGLTVRAKTQQASCLITCSIHFKNSLISCSLNDQRTSKRQLKWKWVFGDVVLANFPACKKRLQSTVARQALTTREATGILLWPPSNLP